MPAQRSPLIGYSGSNPKSTVSVQSFNAMINHLTQKNGGSGSPQAQAAISNYISGFTFTDPSVAKQLGVLATPAERRAQAEAQQQALTRQAQTPGFNNPNMNSAYSGQQSGTAVGTDPNYVAQQLSNQNIATGGGSANPQAQGGYQNQLRSLLSLRGFENTPIYNPTLNL